MRLEQEQALDVQRALVVQEPGGAAHDDLGHQDVHGRVAFSQARPNTPRLNDDGDPVKYETPAATRMVLDVHDFLPAAAGQRGASLQR